MLLKSAHAWCFLCNKQACFFRWRLWMHVLYIFFVLRNGAEKCTLLFKAFSNSKQLCSFTWMSWLHALFFYGKPCLISVSSRISIQKQCFCVNPYNKWCTHFKQCWRIFLIHWTRLFQVLYLQEFEYKCMWNDLYSFFVINHYGVVLLTSKVMITKLAKLQNGTWKSIKLFGHINTSLLQSKSILQNFRHLLIWKYSLKVFFKTLGIS
jgi:hypothetical protein